MGYILTAICPSCHYKRENLYFGSGMRQKTPNLPALDSITEAIVLAGPDEPGLDYYHDPKMYKGDINDSFYQNGDVLLSPDQNYCPHCKTFQMRFDYMGTWD